VTATDPAPPVILPARPSRLWWVAVALAVLGLMTVLALFDPAHYPFYPRCQFKSMTGWSCPGCGGLRAAHQLLHGHVRAAFELNPLLFVLGPVLGWLVAADVMQRVYGRTLSHPFKHRAWLWGLLVLVIGFSIVRNLPSASLLRVGL
jgi:hypothetical protein